METAYCKLEIFVPEDYFEPVCQALIQADAGHIGNYDQCLSVSPVTSFWRPLPGSDPFLGRPGELCRAKELKIEVCCAAAQAKRTIALIKAAHPYEEPVINLIPLLSTGLDGE